MVGVGVVPRGWLSRRVCRRLGVGRIRWCQIHPCGTGELPWSLSYWAIWCLSGVLGVAGSDAMRGTLSVRLSRQVFVCS